MKKTFIFLLVLFVSGVFASTSFAFIRTVQTRTVSSGTYEDGKFTHTEDTFDAVYSIDEDNKVVTLEKIITNNREGRYETGTVYEITNTLLSKGPSALLVSPDKKGQRIVTAVGESGMGASETIILGEDFYEYCKAANGKFYLEFGEIKEKNRL